MHPNHDITLNASAHRFELSRGGHLAIVVFAPIAGGIALVETQVPEALKGLGVGSALVRHSLDHARAQGWRVRPDCPFARAWIARHPEYQDLLPAPGAPPAPVRFRSRAAIVGEDTRITRALPHRDRRRVGAWCFLDHLGPVQFAAGKGMHVGAHPHIGLQTFTWMIEGEVVHRDSLGNEQIIRPGQVNLMTAGRGIAHTEDSAQDGARMHAAQLWIALPEQERQRAPWFRNYPTLPITSLGGFRATVLAGTAFGQTAPPEVYTPLVGIDLHADAAARAELSLHAEFEYAALVLTGSATVEDEAIEPGEWLYFAPGRTTLDVLCQEQAQLLILGGLPFDETIIVWWNLVARTQGEIEAALADWKAGKFAPVRAGSAAAALAAPDLSGMQLRAG